MDVFNEKKGLQNYLKAFLDQGQRIGLVPTMGALHDGHLSLMKTSLNENAVTVVSIFVNPTQFNNKEDLEKYPRTFDTDLYKIKQLSLKIVVYHPQPEDLYEESVTSKNYTFDGLEFEMEGKFRPGHFNGVGTIVQKLFDVVKPTNAYFGEKDFQQLQIIKKLVKLHKIPVKIIPCEIYREPNGLAMSSRNERLSAIERNQAAMIYQTLLLAKEKFGTKSANMVTEWVKKTFEKQRLFTLEYFEIAEESALKSIKRKQKNKKYRAFIAVFVNNIRLIDNISLN
jgi:pantoate--beta-alanine ligase